MKKNQKYFGNSKNSVTFVFGKQKQGAFVNRFNFNLWYYEHTRNQATNQKVF